jgi:hypothetical protein
VLRLVNHYEEIAHGEIKAAADRWGLSVYPKVRAADVVPNRRAWCRRRDEEVRTPVALRLRRLPANSGSRTTRRSSTAATTAQPLRWHVMPRRIASGAGRPSDPAHQQQLFDAGVWPDVPAVLGHGCLRTSTRLRRPASSIPLDEPFDPFSLMSLDPKEDRFPYWLSAKPRIRLQGLH